MAANVESTGQEAPEMPEAIPPKPRRPARSQDELQRINEARARRQGRREPVSVSAARTPEGKLDFEPPHNDGQGWLARLTDALGTGSDHFALAQLRLLVGMLPPTDNAPQTILNSLLAAVEGIRPLNEAEGMLAVQMASTHHVAMECLARTSRASNFLELEANGVLATKLLRTYALQLETLTKLRRGGSQKVTVEHVHVYQGAQAIVGNASAPGGGQYGNGGQAHELTGPTANALPDCRSLLRQDPAGNGVPVASSAGEEAVPNARRRTG
ncbi:hypothetical protein [Methylobacterium sp. Leaf99]|uniref:hypothetical protein n=1 Tax=Methylobacterium sp. Leaf99 TaxID=1736251 RepID=UPI000AD1C7C8|nr:hypothetical protein [Methylobacterium sp. Leaf99]